MTINYSNCIDLWEKIVFWIPFPAFIIAVIAGIMLFSQEKDPSWEIDKKGVILFELLGPLFPLFATKYLSPKAVKYRWWFFGSIAVIALYGISFRYYQICSVNT